MALAERTRSTAQATVEGLRVFVAGVPWTVSEDTLLRDFTECGLVEDLFLLKDAEGNSRGRCFVTFRDAAAVKAALEYDGTEYAGRTIYVKVANDKPKGSTEAKPEVEKKAKEVSYPADKPKGCVSLCLKNLGEATEADVRKFLKGCSIQAVRIVCDRTTGASRGIAFVDFPATEEVDKAIKKSGTQLNGQAVDMRFEAPRSRPRPDGCMAVAVKKLSPETTEADIWTLFEGLDSISDVRVIRKEKACIGLAFAEFATAADVEAAVRRDGMAVRGQTAFICYETKSRKMTPWGDAGKEEGPEGAAWQKGRKQKKPAAEAEEGAGEAEEEQPQASKKKSKAKQKQPREEDGEEEKAKGEEEEGVEPTAGAAAERRPKKKRRKGAAVEEEADEGAEVADEALPERKPTKKKKSGAGTAQAEQEEEAGDAEVADEAAPERKPKKKKSLEGSETEARLKKKKRTRTAE